MLMLARRSLGTKRRVNSKGLRATTPALRRRHSHWKRRT